MMPMRVSRINAGIYAITIIFLASIILGQWTILAISTIMLGATFLANGFIGYGFKLRAIERHVLILDYGNGLKVFTIFGSVFIFFLLLFSAVYGDPNDTLHKLGVFALGIFIPLSWPLFLEVFFTFYLVNAKGIYKHAVWSEHFIMGWDEITIIRFDRRGSGNFIVAGNGRKIRLETYLRNLDGFLRQAQALVPEKYAVPSDWYLTLHRS